MRTLALGRSPDGHKGDPRWSEVAKSKVQIWLLRVGCEMLEFAAVDNGGNDFKLLVE